MNLKNSRASDEEIKRLIEKGFTQTEVMKKLGIHSQLFQCIKKVMNGEPERKYYSPKQNDQFIMNSY